MMFNIIGYVTNERLKRCCLVSNHGFHPSRNHLFAKIKFRSASDLESRRFRTLRTPLRVRLTAFLLVVLGSSWQRMRERVVWFELSPV